MPCYSPLKGYASRTLTANGKRKIVFQASAGYVDKPMTVPCGVCIGCRIEHSRIWALRCVHESKMHEVNSFITLTYDDEHLPEGGTLVKKHVQDFLKRLRHKKGSLRYYGCGEYGDNLDRPHYHLIIFGLNFFDDRRHYKTKNRGQPNEQKYYRSNSLVDIWGLGDVIITDFSYSTAAYTARYVIKKYRGNSGSKTHRINTITGEISETLPEFSIMSLKPGIGTGWYERFSTDAFPSDFLIHDGKRHSVPRYYYEKLKNQDSTMHKSIKLKRKKALIHNMQNYTPERLAVREEVKISQIQTLKRSLE